MFPGVSTYTVFFWFGREGVTVAAGLLRGSQALDVVAAGCRYLPLYATSFVLEGALALRAGDH